MKTLRCESNHLIQSNDFAFYKTHKFIIMNVNASTSLSEIRFSKILNEPTKMKRVKEYKTKDEKLFKSEKQQNWFELFTLNE